MMATKLSLSLKKSLFRPYRFGKIRDSKGCLYLAKPLTYMNRSGEVVPSLLKKTGLPDANLLVVCDTLDLPAGACRLKSGGSSAGHRGLTSILSCLGTAEFLRMYIGVGRPENKDSVIEWVLGEPDTQDAVKIGQSLSRAADAIERLRAEPLERVINEVNQKP